MSIRHNINHRSISTILAVVIFLQICTHTDALDRACGIQYCKTCNSTTNFCYQCDLPYKPAYANQTVCTRCDINCAVCVGLGADQSNPCLSCQPNFVFGSDLHCNQFQTWIYVVVIGIYAAFVICLLIIFCIMKRKKQEKQTLWFQLLKDRYNNPNLTRVSSQDFENLCSSAVELLKEASSYNNLKFKDHLYETAIKIKSIELKPVENESHIKQFKIKAADNSDWKGKGFIYVPSAIQSQSSLKLWFAKDYLNQVKSQKISKVIIYESTSISQLQISGKWYYLNREDINGTWKGVRQMGQDVQLNPLANNNMNRQGTHRTYISN